MNEAGTDREQGMADLFDGFAGDWSAFYDDAAEQGRSFEFQTRQRRAVQTLIDALPAGARVLEIGCGGGITSVLLARAGFAVTALDISPAMVEATRAAAASAGVDITVHLGAVTSLPDDARGFDAAVGLGVTEYLPDLDLVLHELHDRLAPGGRCVLSFTNAASPFRWIEMPVKRAAAAGIYLARHDERSRQIAFRTGSAHTPRRAFDAMRAAGFTDLAASFLGYGVRVGRRWLPGVGRQDALGATLAARPFTERAGRMFLVDARRPPARGAA